MNLGKSCKHWNSIVTNTMCFISRNTKLVQVQDGNFWSCARIILGLNWWYFGVFSEILAIFQVTCQEAVMSWSFEIFYQTRLYKSQNMVGSICGFSKNFKKLIDWQFFQDLIIVRNTSPWVASYIRDFSGWLSKT